MKIFQSRDTIVCWCAPLPCHGDVLLELANKTIATRYSDCVAFGSRPALADLA
jgi:hypothetical protein